MPELPEVETIRLQLVKYIKGSKILGVEILNPKYEILNKFQIINSKIANIRRFAKQLSIDLNNNYSILIHVKMTGQLIYKGSKLSPVSYSLSPKVIGGLGGKHTHVIFHFDNGDLYYNDVRQFGWIRIANSEQVTANRYAPEPLKDLTFEIFSRIISSSRRNIKVLLMDQTKIGGIGNIYANDALWLAEIRPQRIANSVQLAEQKKLYKAILSVLKAGLKYGGSSESSYVTPDGQEGNYQNHALVYGRQGKPCLKCKTKIEKFFLNGRGTYYCKLCQK